MLVQLQLICQSYVLWHYGTGPREKPADSYIAEGESAIITLQSTWDIKLEPHVIQVWGRITSNLRIRKQSLSSSTIISHGDASTIGLAS